MYVNGLWTNKVYIYSTTIEKNIIVVMSDMIIYNKTIH